jgi:hypothetical protein
MIAEGGVDDEDIDPAVQELRQQVAMTLLVRLPT